MKPRSKKEMLVATCALMVAVLFGFATPSALAVTITVDGQNTGGEWNAVTPSVQNEANEPAIADTVDIKDVYITDNGTNGYWRIDTHTLPPDLGLGRSVSTYIDTDRNGATGCDDVVGHDAAGYEKLIKIDAFCSVQLFNCVGGSFQPVASTNDCAVSTVLEYSVDLASLGIGSVGSIDYFVFYDGGSTAPDDEVPDSGNFTSTPTLIRLESFEATADADSITLVWETGSEMNNAGFHLWRRVAQTGAYERITETLIPAEGGRSFGASYTFDDVNVTEGTTYEYKLQDISLDGRSTFHGPIRGQLRTRFVDLLSPRDGEILSMRTAPTFEWDAEGLDRFQIEFSDSPSFDGRVMTLPRAKLAATWTQAEIYTLSRAEWRLVKSLSVGSEGIYWRVVGIDADGETFTSEARFFDLSF